MPETVTSASIGQAPAVMERRALAKGRPRLALATADLALLWRNSIRYSSAIVLAAFPFVFILDEAVDLSFSPVLPALIVLALLLVLLPPLWVELRARRVRDLARAQASILRSVQTSWACVGLAALWLVFWFSWGV